MGKLLLLFILLPIADLFLLFVLGDVLGLWLTLLLLLITGGIGAILARNQKFRVLRDWQNALARGQVPEEGLLSSMLVLVGGVLLVSPGILTDIVGLILLIPITRRYLAQRIRTWFLARTEAGVVRVVRGAPFGNAAIHYHVGSRRPPARSRKNTPLIIDVEGEEIEIKKH